MKFRNLMMAAAAVGLTALPAVAEAGTTAGKATITNVDLSGTMVRRSTKVRSKQDFAGAGAGVLAGALIGAGAGAVSGYFIGKHEGKKAARDELRNVSNGAS